MNNEIVFILTEALIILMIVTGEFPLWVEIAIFLIALINVVILLRELNAKWKTKQ